MTATAGSAGSSVAGRGGSTVAHPPTLNFAARGQVTKPTKPQPPAGLALGFILLRVHCYHELHGLRYLHLLF